MYIFSPGLENSNGVQPRDYKQGRGLGRDAGDAGWTGAVLRALLFLRRRGACSRDGARRYAQLPGIMFDSHINFFRALHIRSIPQPILNPARDLFNRFALYGNCQYGRGSVISRREVSWIKDRCFTRWRGFNDDAGAILRGSTVVGRSDDCNWPCPCIAHIS